MASNLIRILNCVKISCWNMVPSCDTSPSRSHQHCGHVHCHHRSFCLFSDLRMKTILTAIELLTYLMYTYARLQNNIIFKRPPVGFGLLSVDWEQEVLWIVFSLAAVYRGTVYYITDAHKERHVVCAICQGIMSASDPGNNVFCWRQPEPDKVLPPTLPHPHQN